jgi:hypothetical protein
MKLTAILFFFFWFGHVAQAQIKVDTNYTILARGVTGNSNVAAFIFGNFNSLMIQENSSGKICSPASAQYTFVIGSETFHTANAKEAQTYVTRSKPKDKVFIDNIVMPSGCFIPPNQIQITIQ